MMTEIQHPSYIYHPRMPILKKDLFVGCVFSFHAFTPSWSVRNVVTYIDADNIVCKQYYIPDIHRGDIVYIKKNESFAYGSVFNVLCTETEESLLDRWKNLEHGQCRYMIEETSDVISYNKLIDKFYIEAKKFPLIIEDKEYLTSMYTVDLFPISVECVELWKKLKSTHKMTLIKSDYWR